MSYQSKDLNVIAYANGFTMWHYTTADEEFGERYFNDAADFLRAGDMIVANYDAGADIKIAQLFVKKVSGGEVEFVVMGGV